MSIMDQQMQSQLEGSMSQYEKMCDEIESKDAQIKLLREALGAILNNTDTSITSIVIASRAIKEADKMKGV